MTEYELVDITGKKATRHQHGVDPLFICRELQA